MRPSFLRPTQKLLLLALLATHGQLGCRSACKPGTSMQNGMCVRDSANLTPESGSGDGESSSQTQGVTGTGDGQTGTNAATAAAPGAQTGSAGGPAVTGASAAQQLPMTMANTAQAGDAAPADPNAGDSSGAAQADTGAPDSAQNQGASAQDTEPQDTQAPQNPATPDDDGANANMSVDTGPTCTPSPEQCDGEDNDCDMKVDEQIDPMPCGLDKGICKPGTIQCRNGQWDDPSTQCQGAVGPSPQGEVCDAQRLDENCDGVPNEGCACNEGETMECAEGPYTCKKGTVTCRGGQWSRCEGEQKGSAEKCDGEDNDCDGQRDNGGDRLCGAGQHCAGSRGCVACLNDAQCAHLNDGQCVAGSCTENGSCGTKFVPSATRCTSSGGSVCDGSGRCVGCLGSGDCRPGETCTPQHECQQVAKCGDGVVDVGEECDVDDISCDSQCKKSGWYATCDPCNSRLTCFNNKFCAQRCSGPTAECPIGSETGICYNGTWCLLRCDSGATCPRGSTCTPVFPDSQGNSNISLCI